MNWSEESAWPDGAAGLLLSLPRRGVRNGASDGLLCSKDPSGFVGWEEEADNDGQQKTKIVGIAVGVSVGVIVIATRFDPPLVY